MTKVLWFSNRQMTDAQQAALVAKLGEIEVIQVDKNIHSAFELAEEIEACDVIAIVAPINLRAQFLKVAKDKPVIIAQTKCELVKSADGKESKAFFTFDGWKRLEKVEVVMSDFA